jgi:hypothetical protein
MRMAMAFNFSGDFHHEFQPLPGTLTRDGLLGEEILSFTLAEQQRQKRLQSVRTISGY